MGTNRYFTQRKTTVAWFFFGFIAFASLGILLQLSFIEIQICQNKGNMALVMLDVLNISSYFHIKSVDKSDTELKGYANRTLLYGIIGGIVIGGLVTFTIIAAVAF